jgi:hypothetical protein
LSDPIILSPETEWEIKYIETLIFVQYVFATLNHRRSVSPPAYEARIAAFWNTVLT